MDRRTLLALLLTAAVIVLTPIIFPSKPRVPVDSAAIARDSVVASSPAQPTVSAAPATPAPGRAQPQTPTQAQTVVREETTTVTTRHSVYHISSLGAAPVGLTMPEYRS